jgi:hypothetical protein
MRAMKPDKRQAVEAVISAVANGMPLKQALQETGITADLFNYQLQGARELSLAYARAQEIRSDLLADEVITIADCEITDPQRARNQIQARQWLASKHHSKRYGDRIDLNVSQSLDVSLTLQEARNRLRVVDVDNAQSISAGPTQASALPAPSLPASLIEASSNQGTINDEPMSDDNNSASNKTNV